jgi:adenylate kinase
VQWVLIGDPGAKKHVYAEKLSKLLEVPHISMGTLLRQELNLNSSVYKQVLF